MSGSISVSELDIRSMTLRAAACAITYAVVMTTTILVAMTLSSKVTLELRLFSAIGAAGGFLGCILMFSIMAHKWRHNYLKYIAPEDSTALQASIDFAFCLFMGLFFIVGFYLIFYSILALNIFSPIHNILLGDEFIKYGVLTSTTLITSAIYAVIGLITRFKPFKILFDIFRITKEA